MSPRVCLNAIVRNEILNLPRMLKSVVGHVTSAVILDTGSDDGTPEFVKAFCKKNAIACYIAYAKFENFEQARNLALIAAQKHHVGADYILLMDADMELVAEKPLPKLTAECYTLLQKQGGLEYHNARLLRRGSPAQYHGVTHEYLSCTEQVQMPDDAWWFADHATGSNRGDKYERDTRLLEGYLADHPNDGRTLFYLAQTYRDRQMYDKALPLYRKRIDVGGWDEEVWYSQLMIARTHRAMGDEPAFIQQALVAYNARPSRAEPIHDLARHFRDKKDQQHTAWLFADMGSKIRPTKDLLFVDKWMTDYGFTEEKSILGAYRPETFIAGAQAANKLSLRQDVPQVVRETARKNLYFYLQPAKYHMPSFKAVQVPNVNPDPVYTNTNPSVAVVDGKLKGIVRTVSYRILPDGSYDYNGLKSIRTTNFLVDFDATFLPTNIVEIKRPTDFPAPMTTEVLDVEDLRLIPRNGELWANGCVLERNPHFWREQFIMKLDPVTGEATHAEHVEPKFEPKQHQKNWMPILDPAKPTRWMYKPGVVMDEQGNLVSSIPPTIAADTLSGGGQLIPCDGGWLGIVHEASPDPTNGKRYYRHRWVWYNHEFELQKVSRAFVFFDRQIEFAAGLAQMGEQIVVSFGVLDREAWIATIDAIEVREMIWLA